MPFSFSELQYAVGGPETPGAMAGLTPLRPFDDGVIDFLKKSHARGYRNILLSASSLIELKKQLKELEIEEYFDEVLGIDNIYAGSKVQIALNWIKDKNPDDCLMIGDTLHDLETAQAMNIRCVLVAKGHQAKELLKERCDEVYDDISEVKI